MIASVAPAATTAAGATPRPIYDGGGCPYYARVHQLPGHDPDGRCGGGFSCGYIGEPQCITNEPENNPMGEMMTTETQPALTADDARKILAYLVEDAAKLAELADSLPADMKLPDTVELAGLVEKAVEDLGVLRKVLDRRGAPAWGWIRNRYDHPGGWIARRKKNKTSVHNVPRAFARIAPALLCNPETGEIDMPRITERQVETILIRAQRAVTMDRLKKTGLGDMGIPWEDLITEEEKPDTISVERASSGGVQ
ncbi:hypothetical protein [Parafrankia sp. EUN1f]|uniref:hypothetical protein n=1 Tax=Parafrankia sp. EUN1f TaxID=102897 RepID=UPI0001C47567|nr:hypothetical protein [Parafrankia sp. EUN1f]EFC79305.1 hypothetical protein FrEUN1fDRAFT_7580 [Parafrankia sp. EUN1f]